MPDETPEADPTETDTPDESELDETPGDTDAWGKPKTGSGRAPEEDAAGWKAASEANQDDD